MTAEQGVQRFTELARVLEVSNQLLRLMIEDLAQRGYLRSVHKGCAAHSAGCPMEQTCTNDIDNPTRMWFLTDKGVE